MNKQTKNWVVFTLSLYIIMFLLIPPNRGPKISRFGFYLGFVHAIILNWFAVKKYKLWKMPGDILIYGIPLFTCLSWIPPSIIFAYYFPYGKTLTWKAGYILFFALGTNITQYIHGVIGMWESMKWKPFFSLPLAILTHTIMYLFTPLFDIDKLNKIQQ